MLFETSLVFVQMARSADVIRRRTHGDDAKACDKNAGSRDSTENYLSLLVHLHKINLVIV